MPRTPRGALTLAEEQPRPARHRRLLAGLVVVVLAVTGTAVFLGVRHLRTLVSGEQCEVTAAAVKRGMPPRAATIAIATAMQESKVRNVRFGDRDSLGLFQQRPSQGWGTAEQILNPEYSTNKFYDALEKVKGYASMDIAQAAQKVQRSAAGEAYAQHEAQARVTASVLSGQTRAGIGCALKDPKAAGDPQTVAELVKKDFGIGAQAGDTTVTVVADTDELAWAVGSWAVARATDTGAVRVVVGDREWRRGMQDSALRWSTVGDGASAGAGNPRSVTIHLA
jgi:hypothetical protein